MKDNLDDNSLKNVCFEEALGKLELIVKQLEKGELPLAESLEKFAQGVALSQLCLQQLNTAEQQIDKILQQQQGKIVEQVLDLQEVKKC